MQPTVSDVHVGSTDSKPVPRLDSKQLLAILRRLLAQFTLTEDSTEKAYQNTHSARQLDPDTHKVVGSEEVAPGVRFLYARSGSKAVVQSVHFDASKFTSAQARAWLKGHDLSASQFVAAGGDEAAEKSAGSGEEVSFDAEVLKSSEEERTTTAVVYPAMPDGWSDTQKDWMAKESIREMAHQFMMNSRRYDIHHTILDVPPNEAIVVESWLAPVSFNWSLPSGVTKSINEGDWIVTTKYGTSLWPRVKSGEINAYSIRGRGKRKAISLPTNLQ